MIGSYTDPIATASSWKFAEHQYDYIGNAAGNTSFAVGTTVDLFGWVGASASYDSYGLCTNTSYNNAYYGTGASEALKTDWGSIPGVISACGTGWRTLTADEWKYLIEERTDAINKAGFCRIKTAESSYVYGFFLLPDNWEAPAGFSSHRMYDTTFSDTPFDATASSGTAMAWSDIENAGAVFLPISGYRRGLSVQKSEGTDDVNGHYWSSSPVDSNNAYWMEFESDAGYYVTSKSTAFRDWGGAVRLVKNYEGA